MRTAGPRRSEGAALILVLMVVGVLSILMLQVGLTARKNVSDAQQLQDRAEAWLRLQSREAALEFSLLTNEWVRSPGAPANPYVDAWNFRGQTFSVDEAQYRIQDIAGLAPMPLPGQNTAPLQALLTALGVEVNRAQEIVRQYQELTGAPGQRGATPLQSFGELLNLTDITTEEVALLESAATLYPVQSFNPLSAAPAVIMTRFPGAIGDSLIALQREGTLTREAYTQVTDGALDEFTAFYPGPGFRLEVIVNVNGVSQTRRSTIVVEPYSVEPIVIWSRQRIRGPGGSS